MIRPFLPLTAAALLAGCGTPASTTQSATTAVTSAVVAVVQTVDAKSPTVQAALQKGALVCGVASSTTGKLIEGTAVLIANSAGLPVSVTDQAQAVVAGVCAAQGLVAGPAPATQQVLPVAVTPAAAVLPVVPSTAS